jgi:hypothetical protein
MENNMFKNTLKNNISAQYIMPASATMPKSSYSKKIQSIQNKIDKTNAKIQHLESNEPKLKFSNISAQDLKAIGFKQKSIAQKFSKLFDVNVKNFKNKEEFLTKLGEKLNNFKKLGLDPDNMKYINTASPKVKENREKKENQKLELVDKKVNKLLKKIKKNLKRKYEENSLPVYRISYLSDDVCYEFLKLIKNNVLKAGYIKEVSDLYLQYKNFDTRPNKDYEPKMWDMVEHKRKKTFVYEFHGDVQVLNQYLHDIYTNQKITFKITMEFSFLLIKEIFVDGKEVKSIVSFRLHYASTNTRLYGFENPVVVDNKKDIDNIIAKIGKSDLIEEFTNKRENSQWKFYKFLSVVFHVYEMSTPIGKINELPLHFNQDSNNKALIKYENYDDHLCFWRCLAYHLTKPDNVRRINKKMNYLFNDYYNYLYCKDGSKIKNHSIDIKNYIGVQYVAYDKEYTNQALDNEDYDKKEDEIDLIEKHFQMNINVYTHDEPSVLQIDRRSMGKYDDTLNLMRFNNHFMYIKDLKQIRHCYKCKQCCKIFNNMKACNRHEQNCEELVKYTFPGGYFNKSESIFEKIDV